MTLTDIQEYKYSIAVAYGAFTAKLSSQIMLGGFSFCNKLQLILLDNCVQIMFDYLTSYTNSAKIAVGDTNFFTATEIHDIEQKINNILGTQLHVDFSETLE